MTFKSNRKIFLFRLAFSGILFFCLLVFILLKPGFILFIYSLTILLFILLILFYVIYDVFTYLFV